MRKLITILFIVSFCFTLGIAECQEKDLSKEEKSELEKNRDKQLEVIDKLLSLINVIKILEKEYEKLEKELKTLEELEMKIEGKKDLLELMREASKPEEKYDFSFLDSIKPLEDKKKELSISEKYMAYPSSKYWLDSFYKQDEEYLERIKEENERTERLIDELSSLKFSLEMERISFEGKMRFIEDEIDMQRMMLRDDLFFGLFNRGTLFYEPWDPGYSIRTDRTNYEPLLFTLCTDSKGKMDWTKYGWLKLLLKKR